MALTQVRIVPVSIPRGAYEGATWPDVLALLAFTVGVVAVFFWMERPSKRQVEEGRKAMRDFRVFMVSQDPAWAPLPMSDPRVPFDDLVPIS